MRFKVRSPGCDPGGFPMFWQIQLGLPQAGCPFLGPGQGYPGKSGEGGGSSSPAWAGQVGSANLEMPWPLAAGTGAPAHSSRAQLAGREPG